MKIGIMIDRLNVGGVEKIAIEQVKALRSLGKDAYLVVLRRKAVVEGAFSDLLKEIPIIYLDDRLPVFLTFSFKFPFFYFFQSFHISYPFLLPFVVKNKEFDYFIVHSSYTAFSAITLKLFCHIHYSTFIWDPIGYILQRVYAQKLGILFKPLMGIAHILDGMVLKNADRVLVGGSAHDTYIQKYVPKERIMTIAPSVHVQSIQGVRKKDYILLVTAWKRGKAPEFLFQLLQQIPQLKCKLVGRWLDNEYKREFIEAIKKHKAEKMIEVVGEVSEEELNIYYGEALVLLQINDDRGFGMPALEAAGRGTTFIIPEGQGVCAVFEHEKDGFFTKEKDTETIIKYLQLLTQNKQIAIDIGKHAWKTIHDKYSWKNHAQHLVTILQK